jgi:DNA invertase Pin-like site-specific DNA recombinase
MKAHRREDGSKTRGDFGKTLRAAVWLRVSTGKQDLRSQRPDVEGYCKRKGWTIVERFEEVVSGAAAGRETPLQVLDGVRRGRWDVVVCFRFDRAFRSAGRAAIFLDELREAGGYFVGVDDSVDTSTVMGEAVARIASIFADLERRATGARIRAGLEAARAAGQVLGRPKLTDGPDPAKIVRLRRKGASWSEIADLLACAPTTARRRWVEATKAA